jgi:hypothetical protein
MFWRFLIDGNYGQQQLLLIVLGVLIVGIAIAVGISSLSATNIQSQKDGMVNDLEIIAANAREYFMTPSRSGGGNGSYLNYTIPTKLAGTKFGQYTCTTSAIRVFFTGVSVDNPSNTIKVTLQRYTHGEGLLISWSYTGDFQ